MNFTEDFLSGKRLEDTKYGLVTWTSLRRAIGGQTSAMDTVINLFSTLHQKDSYARGEGTLERVGPAGLTIDELNFGNWFYA